MVRIESGRTVSTILQQSFPYTMYRRFNIRVSCSSLLLLLKLKQMKIDLILLNEHESNDQKAKRMQRTTDIRTNRKYFIINISMDLRYRNRMYAICNMRVYRMNIEHWALSTESIIWFFNLWAVSENKFLTGFQMTASFYMFIVLICILFRN